MKTKLIRIGNSQGIRIPKPLIEESGLTQDIELILRDNEIILRSSEGVRKDWDELFERMAESADDARSDQGATKQSDDWGDTDWIW